MKQTRKLLPIVLIIVLVSTLCLPTYALESESQSLVYYPIDPTIATQSSDISSSERIIYHKDYSTGLTQLIDPNSIPTYNYDTTYDGLTDAEKATVSLVDNELYSMNANQTNSAQVLSSTSSLNIVPNSSYYKGVMLVTVWAEDPDGNEYCAAYGSGILVSNNVILTAAHVANYELPDPDDNIFEVRVYPNIHFVAPSNWISSLANYPYVTVTSAVFGTGTYSDDWYVGRLSSGISNAYLFICSSADSTMIGETSYCIGYGTSSKFQRLESQGTISQLLPGHGIHFSNTIESGMSGGPTWIFIDGRRCCIGINRAISSDGGWSYAIDSTLFNIIYYQMVGTS